MPQMSTTYSSIALRPLSLSMSNFGVIHLASSVCTRRKKTNTLLEQVQLFVATTTKADGEAIATLNTQNAPVRNSSIARDMMHHIYTTGAVQGIAHTRSICRDAQRRSTTEDGYDSSADYCGRRTSCGRRTQLIVVTTLS